MVAGSATKPVGYLTRYDNGLNGERGSFYSYVTAGNGLFVESEGPLLAARVPIADAEIRGLAKTEGSVVLRNGKIPDFLWEEAFWQLKRLVDTEIFIAITYEEGSYRLATPEQERSSTRVKYNRVPNTILDLHSHHKMAAYFSQTDDADETGFQLYGVVGELHRLDSKPRVHLRVGIYGYHWSVPWDSVFDGTLNGIVDMATDPEQLEFIYANDEQKRRWPIDTLRRRLRKMGLWTSD